MSCSTEPTDKKAFGINVYKKLNDLYGRKKHYEVAEIQNSIKSLDYPVSWECWALVAFMLPANVGEYLRAKETPMNVLDMKRDMLKAMTYGERDSLNTPEFTGGKDIELSQLTQLNLVEIVSFYAGYSMGRYFVFDMVGE